MSQYNKLNPFFAAIKERYPLSKVGSEKNTHHIVLNLEGSNLIYEVGDSVGIYSKYDSALIEKTLNAMGVSGDEKVIPKRGGPPVFLKEYFRDQVSLNDVPMKLLQETYQRLADGTEKKAALEPLLKPENYQSLKAYLSEHELWDFLLFFSEVSFSPQEIVDMLMPLLPRFYSISSSQKAVGDEIHLTVAPLEYESRGHKRSGVCTHYLCSMLELHEPQVPLFIQPSHAFRLPEDRDQSIIMVGPGTGVAPFRAFMQERALKKAKGKNWLFFGERNRSSDFFYEEDWNQWVVEGILKVDVAFSRDHESKVYVQHKIEENGEELFYWLENGSYFYVCGDASKMAKDVENSLITIIMEYGKRDLAGAREYVKQLRQQKRYLRDVY
jgi:sulfite reductase (NADPH) flavoprotein alpha-component